MKLTPKARYQLDVEERGLVQDDAQVHAVNCLQSLYEQLLSAPWPPRRERFSFFKRKETAVSVKGLYLWGGVGRGKTFLMDSFFSCLPFEEKRRVHFQHFMRAVHDILKGLPKSPDPLPIVAKQLAVSARIICIDEFHVDDVADAMLLAGLLQGLIDQGVTLVFSSNIPPDELYLNGLQRQRFLPVIELIKKNCHIVELNSPRDYRVGLSSDATSFFVPHNETVEEVFKKLICEKAREEVIWAGSLTINQRYLKVAALGGAVVWLRFDEVCCTAKSYYDYLVIAEKFNTVILSGIPEMTPGMEDVANRFIQLIDALYDHGRELIASAEVNLPVLYSGKQLAFSFQRTQSRLQEMFSEHYRQKFDRDIECK